MAMSIKDMHGADKALACIKTYGVSTHKEFIKETNGSFLIKLSSFEDEIEFDVNRGYASIVNVQMIHGDLFVTVELI